jgi:hypothetical protein
MENGNIILIYQLFGLQQKVIMDISGVASCFTA